MDSQPGGYFDGVEINLLVINSLKFEEKTFGLLLFLHTVQINIVFIFHRYILKKKKKNRLRSFSINCIYFRALIKFINL